MDDRASVEALYRDVTSVGSLSDQALALLPRGKADFERIEVLESLSLAELRPLVRHLMTWIQDSNWPISRRVEALLLRLESAALLEPIREVLATTDAIWKTNTIRSLIRPQRADLIPALHAELLRIAEAPSGSEIAEETAEAAQDVLAVQV
jgi:hypothetical protein